MYIEEMLKPKVDQLFNRPGKHMGDTLGISFVSFKKEEIKATMPVDERTVQPFGILHGGASAALAETLASVGAWLNLDDESKQAVGIEINANHLRSVEMKNQVTGIAVPIYRGNQIQIWETKIQTDRGKPVCISRCTLAIIGREEN